MARLLLTAVLLLLVALSGPAKSQLVEPSPEPEQDSYLTPEATRLPPTEDYLLPSPQTTTADLFAPPTSDEAPADPLAPTDPLASPPRREPPPGFGGPFARSSSPIGFTTTFDPSVSLEGQVGTFTHWGEELRLAAPAWKVDPHLLLVTSSVSADQFNTSAVFPTSGTEFPDSLWNIRLGTFYMRPLDNGWRFGAGLNVGSASDRPFAAIRDVNPAVFTFLNVPRPNDNAWNFALFYSPLSEIPFPVPGVSYLWHASDALQINIGLPAQIVYQPTDAFVFTASYMLLTTVNVRGTWHINEFWSAYAAYESRNRSWYLNDRTNDDDRLFAYEQGLFVGIQRPIWKKLTADISAGYLFDRFYFIGENYDDRHKDRIDLESGATISAQLGVAF